jgi:hypothetical protein
MNRVAQLYPWALVNDELERMRKELLYHNSKSFACKGSGKLSGTLVRITVCGLRFELGTTSGI